MTRTVYSCFDVETTGLDPRTARIIEIAVVKIASTGELVGEWSTLVDAETSDLGRTDIHGISRALLVGAPTFREIAGDLMAELSGSIPVAHSARFDIGFVQAEWERVGFGAIDLCAIDTVPLAKGLGLPGRLGDLSKALGVDLNTAHRALDDSRALGSVFSHFLKRGAISDERPLFYPPLLAPGPTGRSLQRSKG